jgi:hypothetical protein
VEHIIPTGLESVKLATVTTMKETINIKKWNKINCNLKSYCNVLKNIKALQVFSLNQYNFNQVYDIDWQSCLYIRDSQTVCHGTLFCHEISEVCPEIS